MGQGALRESHQALECAEIGVWPSALFGRNGPGEWTRLAI
jgi:hypothetical protein